MSIPFLYSIDNVKNNEMWIRFLPRADVLPMSKSNVASVENKISVTCENLTVILKNVYENLYL